MSFLKKLGAVLLKATEIAAGIYPFVPQAQQGTYQVVSKDLSEIANLVVEVEAVGQALGQPGAQKYAAAGPLVAQVILQSSVMAGKTIADPVMFQKGCAEIGGGMADILNALKPDVPTTNLA